MRKMTFLSQIYEEAVKVGGYLFFAFEEKDDSSISGISFKDVRERQRRYHDAYRRRDIMTHTEEGVLKGEPHPQCMFC